MFFERRRAGLGRVEKETSNSFQARPKSGVEFEVRRDADLVCVSVGKKISEKKFSNFLPGTKNSCYNARLRSSRRSANKIINKLQPISVGI